MSNDREGAPVDAMTPLEAAQLAKVTPQSVREWIRTGKLPAWRRGLRCLLVSRADVVELASGRVEPVVKEKTPPTTRTARQREAGQRRARESLKASGVRL